MYKEGHLTSDDLGDGADRRPTEDVVPQKHAVPTALLSAHRQRDGEGWIGQFVEWSQVQAPLGATLGRRHYVRDSTPATTASKTKVASPLLERTSAIQ